MCDTGACCELFHRYMNKVNAHIDVVDKNLYGQLLNDDSVEVRNLVKNFMSGSQEIKKLMHSYTKQWCPNKRPDELLIGDHALFLKETEGMFDMVLQRIQDETEKLYPLIRKNQRQSRNSSLKYIKNTEEFLLLHRFLALLSLH